DHRRDGDVDRLRGENEAGAAEAVNLEVEAAAAVALPRIIDAPGGRSGQIEARPEDVENLKRHSAELGMHFGRRAAAPGHGRAAAGIDAAFDSRLVVREDGDSVGAAGAYAERIGEVCVGRSDVSVDALRLPGGRKVERSAERAVREHEPAEEPAGHRLQLAA